MERNIAARHGKRQRLLHGMTRHLQPHLRARRAAQSFGHLGPAQPDGPLPVDPHDPVARQQPLGTFIGKAFHKRVDDRDHKEGILGQEQRQQDKAGEEVHKGSRHQNDELSPGRLIGKCPGVVGGVVLPLHGAEAAHGDGAQGILRLPFLRGEQQRPHADGKFVHPHPQQLGGDEVSELMQGDEDTKHENGDDDIEHKRIQSP